MNPRSKRPLWAGPLAALALAACNQAAPAADGAAAKAEAPVAAEPEAPVAAEPEVATKPAAKPKPAKPSVDEGRALRRKLLSNLNEGRKLTKAGKYDEAMARYREALTVDAGDVAVLGELGWAAYKAGDLEQAHRSTTAAMRFAKEDKQLGMLLYNLGRIDEDRGQLDAAVELYRVSLARRPNDIVQKRLDELLAKQQGDAAAPAAAAAPTMTAEIEAAMNGGLAVLARDLADLPAACALLQRDVCEDYSMDPDEPCSCEPSLVGSPGADQSWGLLHLVTEGMPTQEAWFPVVQTARGWSLFASVLYSYNPGAFGIYEEAFIGASDVQALLGEAAGTQLIFHLSKDRSDSDMGLNEIESEHHEMLVVCARVGDDARCTVPLASVRTYERSILFDELEQDPEESFDHEGSLGESHYRAALAFAGGQLKVSDVDVSDGVALPSYDWLGQGLVLPAGEVDLRRLLGLAAAAK